MDLAKFPMGHGQYAREEQDRDEQQISLLQTRRHQRQHEGTQDQDE